MSEELNDELAQLYRIARPKFLGWGFDDPFGSGVAYPVGRKYRKIVEYQGDGVFSLNGIAPVLINSTTGGPMYSGNSTFSWSVSDRWEQPLLTAQLTGTLNLVSPFSNMSSSMAFLMPNDYLIVDYVQYLTTSYYKAGAVYGIEFIELKADKDIRIWAEKKIPLLGKTKVDHILKGLKGV